MYVVHPAAYRGQKRSPEGALRGFSRSVLHEPSLLEWSRGERSKVKTKERNDLGISHDVAHCKNAWAQRSTGSWT